MLPTLDVPLAQLRLTRQIPSGKNIVTPRNPFIAFSGQAIEQSIGSRFREQATRYPDNAAVKTKNEQWTYTQLERLSNRVANAILALRGESEERIALFFRHGASMIAAMLGVLKAGKTYVPLDPLILCPGLSRLISRFRGSRRPDRYRRIFHGTCGGDPACRDRTLRCKSPALRVAWRIAYILYTSGSTGEPKGVVQTHRNVLGQVRNYSNNLHLCANDRLTFVSSYGVDAAVQDIFGALLNGAAVYPVSVREHGIEALVDCLVEQEITVFHSAPTIFRHLVNALTGMEHLEKIRLVVLGGEAVYRRDVDSFHAHFPPDCLLVNGYGLTESTMALQCFIDSKTIFLRDAVPVGYPVDDVEVLLLNDAGQPVDVYCPGEIVLRGPFIAMGYWRQRRYCSVSIGWRRRANLPYGRSWPPASGWQHRIHRAAGFPGEDSGLSHRTGRN